MAKVVLNDIGSGFNLQTVVNANNTAIEDAFDNTLSRDGSTPNGMEVNLDMNSFKVINVGTPTNPTDAVRLIDLTDGIAASIETIVDTIVDSVTTEVLTEIDPRLYIQLACSDLVTNLSTGDNKGYFRSPRAFTLENVRASLSTVSTSGTVTLDVRKNGTTIFSTPLTIDANELTSVTAAVPAVLSTVAVADDDLFQIDIDGAGTGARGLIVTFREA